MKVLTLDIETSPNLAHVWGLWNQNVSLVQLRDATEMLCFAAKWHDTNQIHFYSSFRDGRHEMVLAAYEMLDQADVVVHYNGTKFDIPHLNREFVELGLTPPAPYAQVDLLKVVKKNFRFPSNKLDYVASVMLGQQKAKHEGHKLWVDCMAGDESAWNLMETYNRQDVRITELLYDKLVPWMTNHPHLGLYNPSMIDACPQCGGDNLIKRGLMYTKLSAFQRYRCADCGRWMRGAKRVHGVDKR